MELQTAPPAARRDWSPSSSHGGRQRLQLVLFGALTLTASAGVALAASALWHSVEALQGILRASAAPPAAPATAAPGPAAAAPSAMAPVEPALPAAPEPERPKAPVATLAPEPSAAVPAANIAPAPAAPGGSPQPKEPAPAWQGPVADSSRYDGARCEGVFVYAVTLVERSPLESAVSLGISPSSPATLVRPGQATNGWEVLAITDDWTGMMPVVWLRHEDQVCRAGLTGNPARVKAVQEQARREQAAIEAARKAAQKRRQRARRRARRRR